MAGDRCVLTVHAHPDDESSKGAATIARLSEAGVRTVLVTCTGGEAGDVLNPAASDAAGDLAGARRQELTQAVALLGYHRTHLLGYPDSGMDGAAAGGFATAALEDVVADLVAIMRAERPEVVVTYDPEYAAGHPDHLRCHDATVAAFDRAATDGWQPARLYGTRTHSPGKLAAMHCWLNANDLPSPYGDAAAGAGPDRTAVRVPVAEHLESARRALLAHRSQVAPDEPWFFAVPTADMRAVYPWEDFELLAPADALAGHDLPVDDLFAGLD